MILKREGRDHPTEGDFSPLVDISWLEVNLAGESLAVFDCRFTLGEPDAGRE